MLRVMEPRAGQGWRALLVCVAFVLTSCAGGEAATASPREATQTPTPASTLLPSPASSSTPAPLALPPLDLHAPQTWFAPNMGSVDFPELFSDPDRWKTARAQVDVFQFYANTLSGDPYDIGGDNVLDTFVDVGAFGKLHKWGIPIAIEAGVIKFFACKHGSWAEYANRAIDNVESSGGRVSFIAMDEPLLGGRLEEGGKSCRYSANEAATEVAAFMEAIRRAHPEVQVGTIETIPPQTVAEVEEWITALEAAGAKPAFLHLDVEVADGIANRRFVAGLRRLRDFSEARGIPFGLILTADWQVADSDEAYYRSVMNWAAAIRDGMGRPTHAIFQSWMGPAASGLHEMPRNLPEDAPRVFSHTRLILDGLMVLGTDP
jgi:hypothetical protein